MTYTIALPIADRAASLAFYRTVLALEPFGPLGPDGIPEPLQFTLAPSVALMCVPTGGFGWVVGEARVAAGGSSECLLSVTVASAAAVAELLDRVRAAGGAVVTEAGERPWSYAATFEDPDGHLWMAVVGS